MTEFTPWTALAGGLLIGTAATVLLWFTGRIAGVSSILEGTVAKRKKDDRHWRWTFIAGLVAAAALYIAFAPATAPRPAAPLWVTTIGGFLVGWGTTMGNGCTSGHGVCGLGRLSVRSLAATLMFLATGMITVFVVRHVLAS